MTHKYQAGDEVTIRLEPEDAHALNRGVECYSEPEQIISHTPKRDLLDDAQKCLPFRALDDEQRMIVDAVHSIIQYLREKEAERG